MDEAIYNRTMAALAAQHNPSTPPETRALAFAEIEAFKKRADASEYATYILSNLEHDDFARHFALQCLSVAAATVGSDPGPAGESLRTKAAGLLVGGTKPLGQEAAHITEGVARLVAELAERSFPQCWPGFLEGVLGAWQSSTDGTAAQLAMIVLRNVAEDCTDSQFNSRLSAGRRNDILRAMRPHMEPLLLLTFAYMGTQFQAAGEAERAETAAAAGDGGGGGGGAGGGGGVAGLLLRTSLGMLRRFVTWVRFEVLLTPAHDFGAVCLACLTLKCARDEAAAALGAMVARKLPRENMVGLLERLPAAVAATPPPAHATDDLLFWRTLAQAVGDLVTVNAPAVADDEALLSSPAFAAYLDLAIGLLSHPSPRLSADLHLLFFIVYRMRKARKVGVVSGAGAGEGELLASRFAPLLNLYWPKLIRPLGLEEGLLGPVFEEEFADEEDLVAFYGQLRGQCAGMIRAMAEAFPHHAAEATREVLRTLLGAHATPQDALDPRGRATASSTAWQQLEGFSTVFEGVMTALPRSALRAANGDVRCGRAAADMVRGLLEWRTRDPLMRSCQLTYLSACRNTLAAAAQNPSDAADAAAAAAAASGDPGFVSNAAASAAVVSGLGSLLPGVLDTCFACMEAGEAWDEEPRVVPLPGGTEEQLSEPVRLLRRKAGGALIVLGKALPLQLEPLLGALAQRVQEMEARGTLREMQRMHAFEMLVAVSNAISADPERRAAIVGQISSAAVATWASPEVSALVASPSALLSNCLGLDAAPTSKGVDPRTVAAIHATVSGVSNALNTLQSISRRVESPLVPTVAAAAAAAAGGLCGNEGTGGAATPAAVAASAAAAEAAAAASPFAALWPVVLPNIVRLVHAMHGIWAPECSHRLRAGSSSAAAGDGPLSHVLGMSQQELHVKSNLSGITQPKIAGADGGSGRTGDIDFVSSGAFSSSDGGASGEAADAGGGSLEEMRCRWLTELRLLAYALIGTAAKHGSLYVTPGAASAVAAALLSDLEHMEHRHLAYMLKHAVEPFVLYCPPHLYTTCLPPLLGPLLTHCLQRISLAWQLFTASEEPLSASEAASPLGLGAAAPGVGTVAGGGEGLSSLRTREAGEYLRVAAAYRRDGGVVVGPGVDDATRELVVDKCRRELSRTLVGVLQVWFALTGDLAKAFINYDGHPGASDPSAGLGWGNSGGALAPAGGGGGGAVASSSAGGGGPAPVLPAPTAATSSHMDAAGAAKYHGARGQSPAEVAEAACKRDVANHLARFLFLGDSAVAFPLAGTLVASLLWPDGQSCRKGIQLCHRMVSVCGGEPHYEPLLGTHCFHAACFALSSEPRWLSGLEWDLLNLARDLYCLFAIGMRADKLTYAVASAGSASNPSGGIPAQSFSLVAGRPRAVLLGLGGISEGDVAVLEQALSNATDAKTQKEAVRELIRLAADHYAAASSLSSVGSTGESALRTPLPAILDLPRQLSNEHQPQFTSGGGSGGGGGGDEGLSGLEYLFKSDGS